jgi:homoserine kinase
MAAASAFWPGTARVRVPATSANLGPGFDTFALALSLYDEVSARASERSGLRVLVEGEGEDSVPRDAEHLVARAMAATFGVLGDEPAGLELVCTNRIPHGRGLGSSAAAIVAGILLARALVSDGERRLPQPAVLELANRLEGHPDNVAACLHGGFTIAWSEESSDDRPGAVRVLGLAVADAVVPVVCVPSQQLLTATARGVLPAQVAHQDAVANVSRGALLVAALSAGLARTDLLLAATEDLLHQPYRRSVYPRSAQLMSTLRANRIPATISGAGPTVLALAGADTAAAVRSLAGPDFDVRALAVDPAGAQVTAAGERAGGVR